MKDMDIVLFLYIWMSSFNNSICWRGYHPYDMCFFEYILYLFFDNFMHAYNIFRPHTAPHTYLHHIHLKTQHPFLFCFCFNDSLNPISVVHRCKATHGSIVNWPGATALKKTNSFLLRQPSTVNSSMTVSRWDLMSPPLFHVEILSTGDHCCF